MSLGPLPFRWVTLVQDLPGPPHPRGFALGFLDPGLSGNGWPRFLARVTPRRPYQTRRLSGEQPGLPAMSVTAAIRLP